MEEILPVEWDGFCPNPHGHGEGFWTSYSCPCGKNSVIGIRGRQWPIAVRPWTHEEYQGVDRYIKLFRHGWVTVAGEVKPASLEIFQKLNEKN